MLNRTRIKICGLTNPGEALAAARMGADAIGLVFHPPSPRSVEIDQARAIAAVLPPWVSTVALFVDAPVVCIEAVLNVLAPDYLQFHGDESPAECARYGVPYIKAVRVRSGCDLVQYAIDHGRARALLADAFVPGVAGGSGQTFDWGLLPTDLPLPLILSGGLDPGNVATALRRVRPWAVDVSSGVESRPGRKDATKIEAFIRGVMDEDLRQSGS